MNKKISFLLLAATLWLSVEKTAAQEQAQYFYTVSNSVTGFNGKYLWNGAAYGGAYQNTANAYLILFTGSGGNGVSGIKLYNYNGHYPYAYQYQSYTNAANVYLITNYPPGSFHKVLGYDTNPNEPTMFANLGYVGANTIAIPGQALTPDQLPVATNVSPADTLIISQHDASTNNFPTNFVTRQIPVYMVAGTPIEIQDNIYGNQGVTTNVNSAAVDPNIGSTNGNLAATSVSSPFLTWTISTGGMGEVRFDGGGISSDGSGDLSANTFNSAGTICQQGNPVLVNISGQSLASANNDAGFITDGSSVNNFTVFYNLNANFAAVYVGGLYFNDYTHPIVDGSGNLYMGTGGYGSGQIQPFTTDSNISSDGLGGLTAVSYNFTDNSSGANWLTAVPTTVDEAINRIAAVVGGTVPIP